jgi:hypothetical protein
VNNVVLQIPADPKSGQIILNYFLAGGFENSPAFQGWVGWGAKLKVPSGTKERFCRP